jgi:hypothetical protein
MTLKQARDRVEEIKRIAADDERAHGMEDDLRAGEIALAIRR